MLVISRGEGEEVVVGDDVVVRVTRIRGDKVRLAFDAPTRIAIHRREVYEQVLEERRVAATAVAAAKGLVKA